MQILPRIKNSLILGVSLLSLWGCKALPEGGQFTEAKVVSVGKTHLVLDDGQSVVFVTIEESDKARLGNLKKGDKVKLVTKELNDEKHSVEVDEIITADGTHIPLGS